MVWYFYLIIIAFIIYTLYNIYALNCFGIPHSLSQTYYLFEEKKNWMKYLFPFMMISVACLLIPSWLTLSVGSPFQFTAFLAPMGIMFTGACPTFKNSKFEDNLHTYSAYFAAIMALLWVILVAHSLHIALIWCLIILLYAFISGKWNGCLTYWFETIIFLSTFSSMILMIV